MIRINNVDYNYEKGQTILDVAKQNNIYIPTLCFLKGVLEEANCRICVVETKNGKLVPACQTLAGDFEVFTDSVKVTNSRKQTLKLILSNHHRDCNNCQKNGNCALQELFVRYQINDQNEGFKQKFTPDTSSPCIVRNNNKCILCNRCANVCAKVQDV